MKPKRKIIVSIATSADGFIARADGSFDWLDRPSPKGNYGMEAFWASIDTILWGRKTYDQALTMRGGISGFGPKVKNYVFTHRPPKSPAEGVEFVNEPIAPFAKRLRKQPGKDIWIMGGGGVVASFLDAGQIDEFSIHVIPILIGEGIPLIAPGKRTVPLRLLSTRRYSDGGVHLNYSVVSRGSRRANT
ncbi:MAG TPA: dihydrofolate reductase family protein [Bryobacteraceae bacterium]|jgi:dihydrofolate reductase|nr:dihydrofolate reductase family protein [Bryobacteraceae bacterium]